MNKKEAAIINILAGMGVSKEPELTPAQEEILNKAMNNTEQDNFIDDVHRLFVPPTEPK